MALCHLYNLPNELLLSIFVPLPTPVLLPLTLVSHRIYFIILRILRNRLVAATELCSYSLLLECYHPSAKLTEPPYFCTHHGTNGLPSELSHDKIGSLFAQLGAMRNVYSYFRPHRRELEASGWRVTPRPGDIPGSRTYPGATIDKHAGETVRQTIGLEAHELFTQLVAQINLVDMGPRHRQFPRFIEIEEGVVRVWRDWLRTMATKTLTSGYEGRKAETSDSNIARPPNGKEKQYLIEDDENILWVSPSKNVGLRFTTKERRLQRDVPVLVRVDEDLPVCYEIEYDVICVRTTHLLLRLEQSMMQEDNSGRAVVFGSLGSLR